MDIKTLEKISKKESSSPSLLGVMPEDYIKDCQEAMDYAFKTGDYEELISLQILIKNISEKRIGKILKFAVYRSGMNNPNRAEPIVNMMPCEERIFNDFMRCIEHFNDDLDLQLNGYLTQVLRR